MGCRRVIDELARISVEGDGAESPDRSQVSAPRMAAWAASLGDLTGSVLVDTDELLTVWRLLEDADAAALTPLNLWELSGFCDQVVCYRQLWHFADDDIDDDAINARLGARVLMTIPETDDATCHAVFTDSVHEAEGLLRSYLRPTNELEREERRTIVRAWTILTGQRLRARDVFGPAPFESASAHTSRTREPRMSTPPVARPRAGSQPTSRRPSKAGHTRQRVDSATTRSRLDRTSTPFGCGLSSLDP